MHGRIRRGVVTGRRPRHFPILPSSVSRPPRPAISDCILIFVRAPQPRSVKTRLAAEIGHEAALLIYRRLAEHAVAEARAVGAAVSVRVHFTPLNTDSVVREWLGGGVGYFPQRGTELGERMRNAFEDAFAAGHGRVVIIGSDLPGLSAGLLRDTLALLGSASVVVGPARDGGYYLLGLRAMVPGIFEDIAWSTPEVLDATLSRLAALGITPALLPVLGDVDVAADLPDGWREWAAARVPTWANMR